jgi:glycerophosphoryl diester phosphodiesterase
MQTTPYSQINHGVNKSINGLYADAQLSRDHIVVLYHDFHFDDYGLPIAVNDITVSQFLSLKPPHAPSLRPTPTLKQEVGLKRRASVGDLPKVGVDLSQKSGVGKKWPWKGNGDGTIQEPFTTLEKALKVRRRYSFQ